MQASIQYINTELADHYPTNEIKGLTRIIIEAVLGWDYTEQVLNREILIKQTEFGTIRAIVNRLKKKEPIQYILGYTQFCDLKLKVDQSVLIPRHETEELVYWIEDLNTLEAPKILDIGTGSGCIPLALKHLIPKALVDGIDISEKAIEVAKQNALNQKLEVNFLLCDILNWENYPWNTYDIIVSNPPYVCEREKVLMETNVLQFEPGSALFVPDDDPLLFYRKIVNFAKLNLKENGLLFLEINEAFGRETSELLQEASFENIQLRKDLNGKDRMISCRKKIQNS